MADGQEAPPLDSGRSDDLQFAAHPGVKRQPLSMSLGGKLNLWGAGDAGGADQNSAPVDIKKTPGRQSLSEKMQRLLNLKSATSGGLTDAAPSPTGRSGFLSRSLDTTLVDEAALLGGNGSGAGSGPETPKAGKGRAGRTPGKSIWGKLGSGMKSRKTSPATMAARSSFEGANAVELPVPSGGSSGTQCGGPGGSGRADGSCGGDDDGAESCSDDYESSPRRAPSAAGGGFCEETLDLRHAIAAGYVMDGACATPPSLPSNALEAMPDYLLTPGVARILGSGGDGPDPSGPAGGPLATPELLGGPGGGAAPWQDVDATVALLPAAQLARVGHPGAVDATMVLFPQQAAAAPEPETPVLLPTAPAAAAEAPSTVVAAAVATAPAVVEAPAPAPVEAAPVAAVEAPATQEEPLPAKPEQPAAASEAPAAAVEAPAVAPAAESSVDEDMPPLVDVAPVAPVVVEEPTVIEEPVPAKEAAVAPAVAPAVEAPAAVAEPAVAAEAVPQNAEETPAVAVQAPAVVAEEVTVPAPAAEEEPAAAEPAAAEPAAEAEPAAAEEAATASAPASPPAVADAVPPAEATLSPSNSLRLSEEPPSAGAVPPAARGVRESIPLFVLQPGALAGAAKVRASEADLLTAMAGNGDADVDAFLSAGDADADPAAAAAPGGGRRRSSVGGSGRLLGGPQRVSMGGGGAAGAAAFVSRLEPVTEAVPSAANSDGEPESPLPRIATGNAAALADDCSTPLSAQSASAAAAAADLPSPEVSPLQPQRAAAAADASTPAPAAAQQLAFGAAATPGSTPKLPGGGAAAAASPAAFMTPEGPVQSPGAEADAKAAAVAAAVAAARGGAAFGSPASTFESPLEAGPSRGGGGSPTLALCTGGDATLSTLSGPELLARLPGVKQAPLVQTYKVEPSTPTVNLLDRSAVSPSAVYHARLAGTPFVQAAAANVDAARHAPLIDSSPFDLGDMDTMVFREDLDKVCRTLAADSPVAATRPAAATTQPPTPAAAPAAAAAAAASGPGSPGTAAEAAGAAAAGGGSNVADALLTAQLRIMTQKAAGFERQLREAQVESEQLKEQLATLEFEKTELGQQDEFEREARLFAEEQLSEAQREVASLRQQLAAHQQALTEARSEAAAVAAARADAEARWAQEKEQMQGRVKAAESERDAALDRLNFQDMRLTALNGANCELQASLAAEQARVEDAERKLAAKDQDITRLTHELSESHAQTEKAVEQVCSANMAAEQASAKAASDRARLDEALAQLQASAAAIAERDRLAVQVQHYALLKQKYAAKSAALKEAQAAVAAKEAENGELMAMCDQLLAAAEGRAQ